LEQHVKKGNKNGISIASLVVGILSLFIPYIGIIIGVLGVVLGVLGLHDVKVKGQGGKGLAIAGIVCSGITIIYFLIVITLFALGIIDV